MKETELIQEAIQTHTGSLFRIESRHAIGGGCISDAFEVSDGQRRFFIKTNAISFKDAFATEAVALREIAATRTLRVPEVIATFESDSQSFLILEFLDTRSSRSGDWRELGRQLAELHSVRQPYFGWARDNLVGATPQPNPRSDTWIDFFRDHRLAYQLRLCHSKGFTPRGAEKLLGSIGSFFEGHTPYPSLLHGDLWSGNVAFQSDGSPFVFDPASYYGDREADVAFTEFFGGFGRDFYRSYEEVLPLNSGYAVRKTLYNLYHCLNHVYLFGSSYASQASHMTARLLAEL